MVVCGTRPFPSGRTGSRPGSGLGQTARNRPIRSAVRSWPDVVAVTLERSLSGRNTVLEFGPKTLDGYGFHDSRGPW